MQVHNLKLKEGVHLEDISTYVRVVLTFQSLAVSLRTTSLNIQKFYMVLALH
jgi:hypothetical protein